mmetsp:Transcript_11012/g.30195  ORF Transcript_11012/g.30195 Transcript_11012/m.30195 type:complete len:360 (+) Transcript_11012:1354-2433(+)
MISCLGYMRGRAPYQDRYPRGADPRAASTARGVRSRWQTALWKTSWLRLDLAWKHPCMTQNRHWRLLTRPGLTWRWCAVWWARWARRWRSYPVGSSWSPASLTTGCPRLKSRRASGALLQGPPGAVQTREKRQPAPPLAHCLRNGARLPVLLAPRTSDHLHTLHQVKSLHRQLAVLLAWGAPGLATCSTKPLRRRPEQSEPAQPSGQRVFMGSSRRSFQGNLQCTAPLSQATAVCGTPEMHLLTPGPYPESHNSTLHRCFSVRKRGGWRPKKVLIWSELRCSGRGPPPGCQAVAGVTPAQWPRPTQIAPCPVPLKQTTIWIQNCCASSCGATLSAATRMKSFRRGLQVGASVSLMTAAA